MSLKSKSAAWPLIFLAWLVYATSYLGKVNYSANITQIIDFYGVTKAEAGLAPTFFFFAYGVGQVINGIFCKRYAIKWTVFGGLLVSAAINFTIAVSSEFSFVKWLWLINGFALSVLWPSLIRLLSESMPQKMLAKSSLVIGTTVATGTLVIYGLSALYAAWNSFKLAFYTAAFAVLVVAFIWLLWYDKMVASAVQERTAEEAVSEDRPQEELGAPTAHGKTRFLLGMVAVLCICAVGVNLIKDGLLTWVPAILKESFSMNDSLSILLTLFMPILAIFGNAVAIKMHGFVPRYVMHCGIVFAVIAGLVMLVVGSLTWETALLMLIGLIAANFLASSLNSLLTSVFPLFMRTEISSGRTAGIINGFCYLGSTISSYGLGSIADRFGWGAVFWFLCGVCAVLCVACLVFSAIERIGNKQKERV